MARDEASAVEGADLYREMFRRANMVKPEQPVMTMIERRKVIALLAAYERAMLDASVRIPSYLHATIEAFK